MLKFVFALVAWYIGLLNSSVTMVGVKVKVGFQRNSFTKYYAMGLFLGTFLKG
jgi:hypothetical protein